MSCVKKFESFVGGKLLQTSGKKRCSHLLFWCINNNLIMLSLQLHRQEIIHMCCREDFKAKLHMKQTLQENFGHVLCCHWTTDKVSTIVSKWMFYWTNSMLFDNTMFELSHLLYVSVVKPLLVGRMELSELTQWHIECKDWQRAPVSSLHLTPHTHTRTHARALMHIIKMITVLGACVSTCPMMKMNKTWLRSDLTVADLHSVLSMGLGPVVKCLSKILSTETEGGI